MALGFHKSLFGYNCDEVVQYIQKSNATNQEIQNSLNQKIKDNQEVILNLQNDIKNFNSQINELSQQADFYKTKYEEIKTLSENIGKLYLVAQTNAKAIITAAQQSKSVTDDEINSNIALIDKTNASLNSMKQYITQITDEFTKKVDELNVSLIETKAIISGNSNKIEEHKENFDSVYESITK